MHGRNGHSIKSWVDSGTGFSWLEEVQQRFPNARIMSYGYEAQIFNEAYSQPGSSSQHRDSHSGTLEQIATDFIQELGTKFDECSTVSVGPCCSKAISKLMPKCLLMPRGIGPTDCFCWT